MTKNKSIIPKCSKFFINEESLSDLADFLTYTVDKIEETVSPLEDTDLDDFDNLDDEEREYAISGLWFAANITADEVCRLLDESERVVADYRRLSTALRKWKHGEPNPITDPNLVFSFHWDKRKSQDGSNIYELQHEDVNLLSNYMIEDLFPYFSEAHFTKKALDYITESITD